MAITNLDDYRSAPHKAKKVVIPEFALTLTSESPVEGAEFDTLSQQGQPPIFYYAVPMLNPHTEVRRDNKPKWVASTYRLFPEVLCGDGLPRAEANRWLLNMLELQAMPNMPKGPFISLHVSKFHRTI